MPIGARGRAKRGLWTSLVPLAAAGGFAAACQTASPEPTGGLTTPIIGGELDTTHRGVVSLLKQVQGVWTAHDNVMTDLQRKTRTRLTLDNVQYNMAFNDDDFTLQSLRRRQ